MRRRPGSGCRDHPWSASLWANADDATFQSQLRLAWADGLPTNGAQLETTIPTASQSENAAPIYRKMGEGRKQDALSSYRFQSDIGKANGALLRNPSTTNLEAARKLLQANRSILDLADQATKLPRCWFNRDWSLGMAVLLPEFADMKNAAKLLEVRGSVAASQGDVAGAIKAAREIMVVSRHSEEDGLDLSMLEGESICSAALYELAAECVLHPSVRAYRDELKHALVAEPKPDLVRESRYHLWQMLSTIDLCSTAEGRKKLGMKDDSVGAGVSIISMLLSPPRPKVEIVKADRQFWAALKMPSELMPERVSDAVTKEHIALFGFPLAMKLLLANSSERGPADPVLTRIENWRVRRLPYEAVVRATANGFVARSIRTTDLADADPSNPMEYSYDGKQVSISVVRSEFSRPATLKLPPDEPRD